MARINDIVHECECGCQVVFDANGHDVHRLVRSCEALRFRIRMTELGGEIMGTPDLWKDDVEESVIALHIYRNM